MTRMTATEAARTFSDVLNRVANGEEIEVTRSGAPVALIAPVKSQLMSAGRLRELLATVPMPDEDFAQDLKTIRSEVEPPDEPWPS